MDLPVSDDCDLINSLDARMTRIKIDDDVERVHIPPYSENDGCHPSKTCVHEKWPKDEHPQK